MWGLHAVKWLTQRAVFTFLAASLTFPLPSLEHLDRLQSDNRETTAFDCKESFYSSWCSSTVLSQQVHLRSIGHTVTHNSHQSLSIIRWGGGYHFLSGRGGRGGPGGFGDLGLGGGQRGTLIDSFHIWVEWTRVPNVRHLIFFILSSSSFF